jgi:anthranilate/para-aminobenzoate synthase component I
MPLPSLTKKQFLDKSEGGHVPPLSIEIPYCPPPLAYEPFRGPNTFLFESVKGPDKIARFSFIGFDPFMVLRIKDGIVETESVEGHLLSQERPLSKLGETLGRYRQISDEELPLFQGGAAGIISYDFVHYLERLPRTTMDDLHIPDAHLLFVDRIIAFDHRKGRAWAIVCPGARRGSDDRTAWYEEATDALDRICEILGRAGDAGPSSHVHQEKIEVFHEMKREEYVGIVNKAKEYIAAGDIFQANLSQRVSAYVGMHDPWKLYMILRDINPSPFSGFIDFGSYHIVSSSPERLVRVGNGVIETRPIAGTRPRGRNVKEDKQMRRELLLNEKERAEHIMLIDLERNDIGKVSAYGTVGVDELMITEDYSHVIHIVSNVRGSLVQHKTTLDVIRAVFPGGTITGVPKVRCMEIIDELEPVRRGPYTGSMGYIGFDGNMDLNILIRSFVIKNGFAYVQAGSGIVADSDPEREYQESLKKAEALIRTLERVS